MYNFVINPDYWDAAAESKLFNRIRSSTHKEEDFWNYQDDSFEGLQKDMKFLDFGCGPGRIVRTVAPQVKSYHGVDICSGLIAMATEHHKEYKNVQFSANNGRDLGNFEDGSFDFVYENLVFIHILKEGILRYLPELCRVIKPGGYFVSFHFPKEGRFINGLSYEEIKDAFSTFQSIEIKECENKAAYIVKGQK